MTWPAWRDGRKISARGPRLHAATSEPTGDPLHSSYKALCGHPVRYKVEDAFDPDDDLSCLDCATIAVTDPTGASTVKLWAEPPN